MKTKKVKSQSFLEYAVLICVFVAALVAMRVYFTRAVQEKYRQSADVFGQGEQYAKGKTVESEVDTGKLLKPIPEPVPVIGPGDCPHVIATIDALKKNMEDLLKQAADLESAAAELTAIIPNLKNEHASLITAAEAKETDARDKRTQAADKRNDAAAKETEAADIRATYPDCFSGFGTGYFDPFTGEYIDCTDTINAVSQLETDAASLRVQATALDAQAATLDKEASDLRVEAAALWKAIIDLQTQQDFKDSQVKAVELEAEAASSRSDAAEIQKQIDDYKARFPECF